MKNPRKESEKHYYNPDNQNLKNLGYVPSTNFEERNPEVNSWNQTF